MAYYPKHYITTNLYTNGGEFQYLSNSIEYVGYYWKTGGNRYFTGETPQDKSQQEIIPISTTEYDPNSITFQDNPTNTEKVTLASSGDGEVNTNINEVLINDYLVAVGATTDVYKTRYLPQYNPQPPTQDDYQIGEMRRYFAKKVNELLYIEIDKETYNKLQKQNPEITWELYVSFNIPWSISGTKEQVSKTNKNIVDLTIFNNKFYRFNDYLKNDYLKYYK